MGMSDVSLGDELLGFNHATGQTEFSAVRAWLHRDLDAEVLMTNIRTDVGNLVATPMHSLASGKGDAYTFARDFLTGDTLITPGGSAVVRDISLTHGQGLYAPLTMTSNYFVGDGTPESSFLAHNFAHLATPQRYDSAIHGLLSVVELFKPSIHAVGHSERSYVHPVMRVLARVAGIQVGGATDHSAGAVVA